MASTYLERTLGTPTSQRIFTISAWIKISKLNTSDGNYIIGQNSTNESYFRIDSSNRLMFADRDSGSGSSDFALTSNAFLRDVSAWYHVVLSVDTTQATDTNRGKLYINGELQTLSSSTYPPQNYDTMMNLSGATQRVGRVFDYFDGEMAHVHFIDGTAYDADTFGETDATTGIWKPKTAPSVTYGTNGFFLKFENSAAFGTDSSGNSNTFTVNGTMTQTIDTPSNVFATINPLAIASNGQGTATLSNGNLNITSAGGSQNVGTLASSIDTNSKWYYEFKVVSGVSGTIDSSVGWSTDISAFRSGSWATLNSLFLYASNGQIYSTSGWTSAGTAPTYTNGDIIGCTVDLENNEIKWYKNGTLAYTISSISFVGDVITPHSQWDENSAVGSFNFGNGYFGTTAVSSAQNPDDGIGIFEYDVPTGYRALCTKSINAEEYI